MSRPLSQNFSIPILVGVLIVLGLLGVYGVPLLEKSSSNPQPYKTVTVEADGSITKQMAVLSEEFLSKLPERFLRYFIFGANPEFIEAANGAYVPIESPDAVTVVFSAQTPPASVRLEYKEYFEALGATSTELPGAAPGDIFVENGGMHLFVSIKPHARGSEVRVSIIPENRPIGQP